MRLVLEVGYVGSRGIKLFMAQNLNQQKIYGTDFLKSFQELQAYQLNNSAVPPANNTLVEDLRHAAAAITALGATNVTQGQVGSAADDDGPHQLHEVCGRRSARHLPPQLPAVHQRVCKGRMRAGRITTRCCKSPCGSSSAT